MTATSATALVPLAGPPDQIGILVPDLAAAAERYSARLGLGPWRGWLYGPGTVPRLTYRGKEGRYAVRIALAGAEPQIELLEPVAGPSIYEEWLERRGEGLHHLGFYVDSVDAAIDSMARGGFALLQSGAGYGLDGDGGYAYFDTEREFGVILEALEIPARRREPDFTWG